MTSTKPQLSTAELLKAAEIPQINPATIRQDADDSTPESVSLLQTLHVMTTGSKNADAGNCVYRIPAGEQNLIECVLLPAVVI